MTTTTAVSATPKTSELKTVQTILKFTFGLVPIVAGLDKFTNVLTTWTKYLAPQLVNMLPFSPETFMMIVGVIEIIAGILVLVKTEVGAFVVAAWLALIAVTLIIGGQYFDVAVRDLVMAISAYCLGRLSRVRSDV
jgi:uncharacterized membrane protein YphA (DoxX/SURF4 family)